VEVEESDIRKACETIVAANPGVPLTCEPNVIVRAALTPNDPKLGHLYGLTKMAAEAAWEYSTGSPSVVVAIVDTGVNYNHPDLQQNIFVNQGEIPGNSQDDDSNGYIDDVIGYDFANVDANPDDDHGHGSHCAGIVGAKGNNGVGVVGINWNVGILPVKALDSGGSGTNADVAAGIEYAVDRGASIVSLSLGSSSPSSSIQNAIAYARAHDVLVVAAAGNDWSDNDLSPTYPASFTDDNLIAVAATTANDSLAYFSNFGVSSVDVGAPGDDIESTVLGSGYDFYSGTSMATPYVAGLAALVKSVAPGRSYLELREIVLGSVDPLSSLSGKTATGGRVNAHSAVQLAMTGGPYPTPVVDPTPRYDTGNPAGKNILTLRKRRVQSRLVMSGHIRSSARVPLAAETISLRCKGLRVRRTESDEDGYFGFKISRPRQTTLCHVSDSESNRSERIAIP
jgi:subtilisin family serine protease